MGFLDAAALTECHWLTEAQTLCALALVCKPWHAYVLPLLYRDVCFRTDRQIALFLRTVDLNQPRFVPLIRNLAFMCPVDEDFLENVEECIAYLFAISHSSVRKVTFANEFATLGTRRALFACYSPHEQEPDAPFDYLPCIPGEATEFWLASWDVPVWSLRTMFDLVKLSVAIFSKHSRATWPLDFDELQDLTCYTYPGIGRLPDHWNMPNLRRFRIRDNGEGCLELENPFVFFEEHGSHLAHVDLSTIEPQWDFVLRVVEECPGLRHLALKLPSGPPENIDALGAIPYIDLFVSHEQAACGLESITLPEVLKKTQIRLLDLTLLKQIPDLPTLLPPDETIPVPWVYDMFSFKVRQTQTAVYRL